MGAPGTNVWVSQRGLRLVSIPGAWSRRGRDSEQKWTSSKGEQNRGDSLLEGTFGRFWCFKFLLIVLKNAGLIGFPFRKGRARLRRMEGVQHLGKERQREKLTLDRVRRWREEIQGQKLGDEDPRTAR